MKKQFNLYEEDVLIVEPIVVPEEPQPVNPPPIKERPTKP
jgi:hypothetical protein